MHPSVKWDAEERAGLGCMSMNVYIRVLLYAAIHCMYRRS